MMILGLLSAILMGLVLGLIGGGGSILAVPILVYLFHLQGTEATFHSLLIVGVCSAVGTVSFAKRGLTDFKTGLQFFLPSVLGVLFSRRLILTRIPPEIAIFGLSASKDAIILASFAVVMLAASWSMLRTGPLSGRLYPKRPSLIRNGMTGVFVGTITGFVGAGGGFLIVPALVNGVALPIERAVGTSLFIMTLNSLVGFTADWLSGIPVHWDIAMPFMGASLVGILLGTALNRLIPSQRLKPLFGWFVLILGVSFLGKQLFSL